MGKTTKLLLLDSLLQERRMSADAGKRFSQRLARNATLSRRAASTSRVPTSTVCGGGRLGEQLASPTPRPTSARGSPGTRTPSTSTWRTPRSTSPAPRWSSPGEEEEGQERPDSLHQGVNCLDIRIQS